MRTDRAPGPLLRLAIGAAALAAGLVVVSAALELGRGHWGAALVALPLLEVSPVGKPRVRSRAFTSGSRPRNWR